ncbi:type I restriction-modification system subunit M [Coprococcus catus]|uniref:type I restriction-modification system subunit M n=1 Tax=Coprococcus catus TaxID=116085 RepID=UPI001C8C9E6A|nr:class I SAM-dependent DNA methyltransferase [Coprococcus catus]MBX9231665.1 SAM-dependent DNA methyltransferase [Coprococcus catus]MCT6801521.1 SAM-dependent DNA methyltransferase [Coprococcus catus]
MSSNDLITNVGKNSNDTATLIWSVADDLVGAYKPHEYGLVILPMTVIKRFHDCLLPTHQAVLDTYKRVEKLAVKDGFLRKAAGNYKFYNTSPFTFQTLIADPDNIVENFKAYLSGFSDNVQDILARMEFDAQVKHMEEAGLLYQVISDFCTDKGDFSPEKISAVDMGYVFENLVRRFSESYNEEAGAHFTSRDIIYLMSDLLVAGDESAFKGDGISKTVYDMTMGTSQMLTCMEERLKQMDADADVTAFGQEFNPFTFGIAKADMLIRGGDPNNMQFGDTLSDDKFSGYKFDYVISNPPFGIPWKREEKEVTAEFKKGEAGRFAPGLPAKGDGQLLFMLNGLAKLKDDGQMAIIQNGSSLFNGDAGSGPSEIRRYLIENDWLDAIVQLPNNAFYNTGIATYIWLVMKNRPEEHLGKVQLIDASKCCSARRKNIGSKNVDITKACRDLIVKAYGAYVDKNYEGVDENGSSIVVKSKVMDAVDFGYNKIVVETPQTDENGNIIMKKNKPVADTSKRDTENVPLAEDIDAYFEREVIPYNPQAWIDKSKIKVGYEIPFTRTFYEYQQIEPSEKIAARIEEYEKSLMAKLHDLFGGE